MVDDIDTSRPTYTCSRCGQRITVGLSCPNCPAGSYRLVPVEPG